MHSLREYRQGDDERLIHWRSTARAQALTVREMEAETTRDVCIRLVGSGGADPEKLERGLSDAASLAVHFLRAGAAVELAGPGVCVPGGRGREHERRILIALALYRPGGAEDRPRPPGPSREVRVEIG